MPPRTSTYTWESFLYVFARPFFSGPDHTGRCPKCPFFRRPQAFSHDQTFLLHHTLCMPHLRRRSRIGSLRARKARCLVVDLRMELQRCRLEAERSTDRLAQIDVHTRCTLRPSRSEHTSSARLAAACCVPAVLHNHHHHRTVWPQMRSVETLRTRVLHAAVLTLPGCQPSAGAGAMDRATKSDRGANPRSVVQRVLKFALTLFRGRCPLLITITLQTRRYFSASLSPSGAVSPNGLRVFRTV